MSNAARSEGRSHQGTDLMGTKLAPVVAVLDGVIETMLRTPRAGYHIMIDHGDGVSSWYMHLNNDTPGYDDADHECVVPGLERGSQVDAGQIIGWVGDSGNAEFTPPHVHFEIHPDDGAAINPYPFLAEACG